LANVAMAAAGIAFRRTGEIAMAKFLFVDDRIDHRNSLMELLRHLLGKKVAWGSISIEGLAWAKPSTVDRGTTNRALASE
jgi:hypothetical protein